MATARHRVHYVSGTGVAASAQIDLVGHDAHEQAIALEPFAPDSLHVKQMARASDGARSGMAVLEQLCIGAYGAAGFTYLLDEAKVA